MQKCHEAHRQDHAPPARDKALPHHWLISPAWRYALNTLDLLEKEAPFVGADMKRIGDVEERGGP
jgi:hypothetical protein